MEVFGCSHYCVLYFVLSFFFFFLNDPSPKQLNMPGFGVIGLAFAFADFFESLRFKLDLEMSGMAVRFNELEFDVHELTSRVLCDVISEHWLVLYVKSLWMASVSHGLKHTKYSSGGRKLSSSFRSATKSSIWWI